MILRSPEEYLEELDNYYKDEANMVADIVIKEYINKKIEELCPKMDLE